MNTLVPLFIAPALLIVIVALLKIGNALGLRGFMPLNDRKTRSTEPKHEALIQAGESEGFCPHPRQMLKQQNENNCREQLCQTNQARPPSIPGGGSVLGKLRRANRRA